MNPFTLLIIYFTIFSGPMVTMLSSSFFLMWIGLEMNLLAMIPLMINKSNPRSMEASTKYFITQATASMIFLMSVILNYKQMGLWTFQPQTNNLTTTLIFISLSIKLGLSPFHAWLPEVTQGIPLKMGLLLLTWQKVAPMTILLQIYQSIDINILIPSALISVLVGAWGGLNQTQTRKIMAYSSISHMGWMISILPYNPSLTIINLIIYIMLTLAVFLILHTHSFSSIKTMSLLWNKAPVLLPIMAMILLSTGGLPPLTGFMPKWLIITELLKNNNPIMASIMAIAALINLFFYTRLIYSTSLTTFPTNNNSKMYIQQTSNKMYLTLPSMIILSTLTLPLSSLAL
ncbi:NADH dehydrogenase subunit 2 (mitochondrion) [Cricetulus griseus]|uniref:NADH-ubiquinone oxidoreductase chain 2 n=1 Tax=Cricetulus griseus TaxID=10029 RepID=Q27PQ4_CRIGR|nr:NADH dehydrogenase subunit 2 [Cricetulus griseus]ABD49727.1 NADH dehydrogenase subunit 2 [Cricetulus griseus]ACC86248.1 NADH dehydrogenase subunit 2 [Cricetulus griseus]AOR52807.1 NADH dehydrogenase subunit 2 [Cricetulus griseus]